MRRLHENRFYRDDALTPENITTIFEAFGWTSIRDWMGRDDDLTFVKGSDRISFDYNPRAGYDFIYYKDFDKNEYSSDYMMYAGVNCAELENDCRDFDKLQATDFLKYKTPQLFMLGDSKPVPVLTESRLRRARLQEADKSRFIIPVWNEVDERGLWSDVKRSAGYAMSIDTDDVELPTQAALIKFVNSGANDKFNNTDWNKFKVNPDTRPVSWWPAFNDLIVNYLEWQKGKIAKNDPRTQFKNDNFEILEENEDWLFVAVLTHEGAQYCDSFKCGGYGAKWCIGMYQDSYWNHHVWTDKEKFVLAYNKKVFGQAHDQRWMLELDSTSKYGTLTAWSQDDIPEHCLHDEKACEHFKITEAQLKKWFEHIDMKLPGVQTFSLEDAQKNVIKLYPLSYTSTVYLEPDTKPGGNIDYDHLQYHVQLLHPADIRELCRTSKEGETDLDLGVIRMMPTSKNGAVISRESTFRPKHCFMGFENVHVKAIWLKYNTPLITFQNCGNVVIDTIYMPRPDDPKGHKEFLESGNTLGAVKDNDCEISFSGCLDVDIKNVKIIPFSKFSVMDINSVYSPDEYGSHFVTLDDLDHKVTNITKNMVAINLNNISNHDIPSADQKNKVFFIDEAIEVSDNITRIQIFNLPIGWEVAWNKELGRVLRVVVYFSTN